MAVTQNVGSIGGVEVVLCARDGIRFRINGLLRDEKGRPMAPTKEELPKRVRVQAAWPPPLRTDKTQWKTAYGEKKYEIFKDLVGPAGPYGADEVRNVATSHGLETLADLEPPEAKDLILNQEVTLEFQWERTADFKPPTNDSDLIPAQPYAQLNDPEVPVAFYGEFTLPWDDVDVAAEEYVAISLYRFDVNATGVPFFVKVQDKWLFQAPPTP